MFGFWPRQCPVPQRIGGTARNFIGTAGAMGAVLVRSRRPEAAAALCREMALALGRPESSARAAGWEDAGAQVIRADAVVHATSLGLPGKSGELPPLAWRAGQLAVDFVYGDTAFVAEVQKRGGTAAFSTRSTTWPRSSKRATP